MCQGCRGEECLLDRNHPLMLRVLYGVCRVSRAGIARAPLPGVKMTPTPREASDLTKRTRYLDL
jgi:hypothetical protein